MIHSKNDFFPPHDQLLGRESRKWKWSPGDIQKYVLYQTYYISNIFGNIDYNDKVIIWSLLGEEECVLPLPVEEASEDTKALKMTDIINYHIHWLLGASGNGHISFP